MRKKLIENKVIAFLGNDDSPDISNPIHSTEVAQAYGFAGALVGGVTVWGWASETIIQALGEDWLENGWSEFSFRQPTFPGDQLTITATFNESGKGNSWHISMVNQSDTTCVIGEVGLGDAPWINELVKPKEMLPKDNPNKQELTLEGASKSNEWLAMQVNFTEELCDEFTTQKQILGNSLFVGKDGIAHPSWIAGWGEQLLRHNFLIPSSMHTKSRVQHRKRVKVGDSVFGGAHLLSAYERKAHHFANFDVLLQNKDGSNIAQLRHWTIFKIATAKERENLA
jgi:acyl dehydratase